MFLLNHLTSHLWWRLQGRKYIMETFQSKDISHANSTSQFLLHASNQSTMTHFGPESLLDQLRCGDLHDEFGSNYFYIYTALLQISLSMNLVTFTCDLKDWLSQMAFSVVWITLVRPKVTLWQCKHRKWFPIADWWWRDLMLGYDKCDSQMKGLLPAGNKSCVKMQQVPARR